MLLRGLVPLALALTALLAPTSARACSCGAFDYPTVERCQSAARVFAGTVESVEFPHLFELERTTAVQLRVDTVWRGDPPAALLAYTSPPCGSWSVPVPGTPFLMCEDDDNDISWTAFGMCGSPLFGEAPELLATLGAGHPPAEPAALAWQPWRTEEFLWSLAAILALPLVGLGLGALAGRLRGRLATPSRSPVRRLVLLAISLIAVRLLLRAMPVSPRDWDWIWELQLATTVALATLVGLWLAYRGQRTTSRPGLALLGTGLMLVAGFVRLHAPAQLPDAIACSEARAREFLKSVPIDHDFRDADERADDGWQPTPTAAALRAEGLRLAVEAVPNACTDGGLRRMHFDPDSEYGPCVEFDDGRGGARRLCAQTPHVGYHEERPG